MFTAKKSELSLLMCVAEVTWGHLGITTDKLCARTPTGTSEMGDKRTTLT